MTVLVSGVQAENVIDGYVWQELTREQKTGVMMGASAGVAYLGEVLGMSVPIFNEEEAQFASHRVDEWYEETFPLYYNVLDVLIEGTDMM